MYSLSFTYKEEYFHQIYHLGEKEVSGWLQMNDSMLLDLQVTNQPNMNLENTEIVGVAGSGPVGMLCSGISVYVINASRRMIRIAKIT